MPDLAHVAAWGPPTPLLLQHPCMLRCSSDTPLLPSISQMSEACSHASWQVLPLYGDGPARQPSLVIAGSAHIVSAILQASRQTLSESAAVQVSWSRWALAQNLGTVRAYCSQPFQPPGSASSSKNSRLHPHEGHSAEAQAGTLPIVGIAWGPAAGSADGCSLLISAGADGHLRGWALQGSQARAHNEQSPGQLPLAALFVVREPVCMQCACLPSRGQGMVVGTHPAGIAQAFALLQEYLSLLCCCSPSASIWTPSSLGPCCKLQVP